jgi:uncharacterized protein (DUF1501 family)
MAQNKNNFSRREFMGQASCAAIGATTIFSTLFNLKTMNAAAMFNSSVTSNPNDYKALVCILFEGGIDSYNMLIPRSNPHYGQYAATRTNLAIPQGSLRSINQLTPDGAEYGLHPSLQHMQTLFNSGKLAFVSNVGTLIQPTTKAQYLAGTAQLPLGLYSHSDQVIHWQTGLPHTRSAVGWGGKIADLLNAANENQTVSMNISMAGSNVFQSGNNSVEFAVNPGTTSIRINDYKNDWILNRMRKATIDGMVNKTYNNAFKNTYAKTVKTGIEGGDLISASINNAPQFNTQFSSNSLSQSFKTIAQIVSTREYLEMSRQIFFINYSGWDHHDNLLTNQSNMLSVLDSALNEFDAAMTQIGMQDSVTTFSLSEFARTLTSNGDGSDHAWGGNTFVMGGAVNGQEIYGTYPSLSNVNNNQEVYGTIIPTTSADQYFRDIALWFGVPPSEISLLFPNVGNFSSNPLGFL